MARPPVFVQSTSFDAGRWAAEELALQLGWLSECPYHGEPFRSPGQEATQVPATARSATEPGDCSSDMYSLALELSSAYSERCPMCARESAVPE
jgi:hypothetical protein